MLTKKFVNSLNAQTLAMMANETLRDIAAFPICCFTRFAVTEAKLILLKRDFKETNR